MEFDKWITIEGPRRLALSYKKLNLNKEKVLRKDFSNFIGEELSQEK